MPRPVKWRKIEKMPSVLQFYPKVNNLKTAGENVLKLEELEAIRLKDLEGLEQGDCAEKMEVSRPTFQRILIAAREKVADSLVNGKSIRIEGGKYTRGIHPVRCLDCGRVWEESAEIPTDVRIANMYAHVVVLNICNVVLLMKMAKRLSGEIAEEHKPEPQMLVADRVRDAVMERDAVPERAGARVWAEDRAYAGRVLEEVPVELPEVIRPT
jgi:predicted DNA-binding protein (UPF0251 family)